MRLVYRDEAGEAAEGDTVAGELDNQWSYLERWGEVVLDFLVWNGRSETQHQMLSGSWLTGGWIMTGGRCWLNITTQRSQCECMGEKLDCMLRLVKVRDKALGELLVAEDFLCDYAIFQRGHHILCYAPHFPMPYLVAELYHGIDAVKRCLWPGEDEVGEDAVEVEKCKLVIEEG